MTIEINGLQNPQATGAGESGQASATQADRAKADQGAEKTGGQPDTVNLTDTARQLNQLEEQARNVSEVDSKRVEEIRHAVESGNYQVDSGRVASKLLQFEAYLPSR